MKNSLKICLVAFALCFSVMNADAQTYANDNTNTTTSAESLQNAERLSNFLATQTSMGDKMPLTTSQVTSGVFISQIGEGNTVISSTSSQEGQVQLVQNGNDNQVSINANATSLKETVVQSGDNNNYLNFSVFNKDIQESEILQQGNNQNLVRHGGNALSDKLKVKMEGQGQSVIIRSFN